MIVRWNVRGPLTDKHEIANASQLSVFAGITYPVATRVFASEELDRIDLSTLGRLAKAFGVRSNPWKLLKIVKLD
jgi:hypothetical protein